MILHLRIFYRYKRIWLDRFEQTVFSVNVDRITSDRGIFDKDDSVNISHIVNSVIVSIFYSSFVCFSNKTSLIDSIHKRQ